MSDLLFIILLIPVSALVAWILIETEMWRVLALVLYGAPVIMIGTIILKAFGVI